MNVHQNGYNVRKALESDLDLIYLMGFDVWGDRSSETKQDWTAKKTRRLYAIKDPFLPCTRQQVCSFVFYHDDETT